MKLLAPNRKSPLLYLALATIACTAPPTFLAAPSVLVDGAAIPPQPLDPADPVSAVLWTLGYDLRELDRTWEWLHDSVPASPSRARAIGMAGLTGIAELGRFEFVEPTLTAFERAIAGFPDDARLPLWVSFIEWAVAQRGGDSAELSGAYEDLREKSVDYPTFTLFGFTLAVAADRRASPALIGEACAAYDDVISGTFDLQFEPGVLAAERMRRMGDWEGAPYNLSGTHALLADMRLRAGDVAVAQEAYSTALVANEAYRWPFRGLVEDRLANAELLALSFQDGTYTEPLFGAGWRGSEPTRSILPGFEGRIGNGTCTLCHTRLTEGDRVGGEVRPTGWVRVRYERPADIQRPFSIFVALPEADDKAQPVGISLGQPRLEAWGKQLDERTYEVLVPSPPGSWFIAGRVQGGAGGERSAVRYGTYTGKAFGLPRFVDVRAGEITDITGVTLKFLPEED